MKKFIQSLNYKRIATQVMLGAALFAASGTLALATPGRAPAATRLNAPGHAPGPLTGTNCSPSCDLYATTGMLTLPDSSTAPMWGYSASNTPGSATLPNPVIIVNQGAPVAITLHNVDLPSATSLSISGQPMIPDTAGVTAGNSKTYTFAAGVLKPGTYLYEAGLTANGPRQVAMGLYGALIVRPAGAPLQAYANPNTSFADEAVLVLSEVDPAFNAVPLSFDMNIFAPKYWLINGKGYPNTDPIATDVGHTVLLRYVNAGLMHHSMSMAGLHQTIYATDAQTKTNPMRVVAQTVPAGSTLDAIVTIPPTAPPNAKYAVFEAAMHLDNKGASTSGLIDFGGMLTFLTVSGTTTTNGGPVASSVSLSPNPTSGPAGNVPGPVTLNAAITASGSNTVSAAEYFVDTPGANGAGCALTGAYGGATASVSASIPNSGAVAPCADLTTLTSSNHTFYVHGQDSTGTWGAVASAVLNLDKAGPAISNMVMTPGATNGTVNVLVQATASDVATGNQNVIAAQYTIDGGAATPITVAAPATSVSLNPTIPAATVLALAEGNHTVAINAQDALGNWGAAGSITLKVDKTGPATSGVIANPNPTNSTFGVQVTTGGGFFERIDATVIDPLSGGTRSNVVAAEYFVDVITTTGTGGAMFATTGTFNNSPTQTVFAAMDLYVMAQFGQGRHTVYVHGKDAAGNWASTFVTTALIVDKLTPSITAATLSPNPSAGANNITLTISASDPVNTGTPPTPNAPASNIVAAEWFIGADPGVGLATPINVPAPAPIFSSANLTFNVSGLALGNYVISFRVMDAAHNWSALVTRPLTISALFADGFESGNFSAWSTTGGTAGRIIVTTGGAQAGTRKMQASISAGLSGFVQDNRPANETVYHARFYFNPNSLLTGTGGNPTAIDIFDGRNTANTQVFRVQYRRSTTTGYQVRLGVARSGGTTFTNWFTINNNAWNAIEIGWQSGASTSATLYTGGVLRQTLNNLNTSAFTLDTVQLGPQGTLGGMTGSVFFDSFVSTRNNLVIGL